MQLALEFISPFVAKNKKRTYVRIVRTEQGEIVRYEKTSAKFIKGFSALPTDKLSRKETYATMSEFWTGFTEILSWVLHQPVQIVDEEIAELIDAGLQELEDHPKAMALHLHHKISWENALKAKK